MISKLKRINDISNPHEAWSFELVATGETFYFSTGPEHDVQLVDTKWDEKGNYLGSVPVGYKKYPPSAFLRVVRGNEPEEIETDWYLPEFLSLVNGDVESKILRLLTFGEKTVEQVCYPP